MKRTDMIVIGAGPAGLSAAINGIARGKTVRVLSGESNYLSKADRVDNYLGYYKISGAAMMEQFLQHAQQMGVYPERGRVANILAMEDYFLINFNGEVLEASTVILATGVSKAKEIPGERELLGRGVSYCATCDGMLYRKKDVIVWGMSQEAAQEANFLNEIGVKVQFVSTPQRAVGLKASIPKIEGSISKIAYEKEKVLVYVGEEAISVQGVFILRDAIAPTSLVEGLEVQNGYVAVNRWMETNLPGLFAAGDCTGKPLQISKATGEGLIAAQQAAKYIDEKK